MGSTLQPFYLHNSLPLTLFGHGKTTKAIAERIAKAIFFDDSAEKPYVDENGFEVYPANLFDPDKSSLEIPSPGIPPSNPLIKKAKNLISEYDLFLAPPFALHPSPLTVWISGTNGKTTTTAMTEHLLSSYGAQSGGNIGTPLAKLDTRSKIWILETSSFTLHYTKFAKPDIYILLPVKPDHISWHGSFENYERSKLKPLSMMKEGDICIIPSKYSSVKTDALKITYDSAESLAKKMDIDTSKIGFKGAFLLDALLALSVSKILFDKTDYEKINKFSIGAHRQEIFTDKRGRIWLDDSKATNPDATIEALKVYSDKKIHLILGGDAKGADPGELFKYMKNLDIKIYLIGASTDEFYGLCKRYKIECIKCEILDIAVQEIDKKHTEKSVALLSPAAASLDQFSSYKERGEKFKKLVLNLS
ncbi:UDP-N-acetylmuramoyl-L-alanine--D-glutamate ligase [Nitrosophilus alvini]|uniref:UDP-N-acetylmuramoyl-L-alanine--D-glutamate ligase n=1 Tax=Nitrosophilus alvini TaxID=2714855 RepID=UPI00190BE48F